MNFFRITTRKSISIFRRIFFRIFSTYFFSADFSKTLEIIKESAFREKLVVLGIELQTSALLTVRRPARKRVVVHTRILIFENFKHFRKISFKFSKFSRISKFFEKFHSKFQNFRVFQNFSKNLKTLSALVFCKSSATFLQTSAKRLLRTATFLQLVCNVMRLENVSRFGGLCFVLTRSPCSH